MGKNRENITWQPISFLPQISNMIDGMLEAAKETYGPLFLQSNGFLRSPVNRLKMNGCTTTSWRSGHN
jgi:hypothetical protein